MASDPADAAAFVEHALWQMPQRLFLRLVGAVVSGQVAFQGLRQLVGGLPDGDHLALEVMRGLPHNVTTEMDLALWDTARTLGQDADGRAFFETHPAQELAAAYQAGGLPPAAQAAVEKFMHTYGVRGVGEVDLGRIRWREDPTPVMQSLGSYLQIDRPEAAPDVVFARGAVAAQAAVKELRAKLRVEKGGWWKAPLAGWLAHRARELAGLRETPKFTIIRIFGEMRAALLDAGTAWTAAGWLQRAEDVAFLRLAELDRLGKAAAGRAGDALPAGGLAAAQAGWQKLVADRRAVYTHEKQRRQSPRLVMGDGTAVYEGVGGYAKAGDKVLLGSPVSSGQVEGRVHVVLDPFGAQLAPGEILVCPGTDPAWTPLFLAAGGLVMEVGGLMTHGSVVAREYGIPAVVGVGQATQLLQTGMRVRVDGSAGTVTILDSVEAGFSCELNPPAYSSKKRKARTRVSSRPKPPALVTTRIPGKRPSAMRLQGMPGFDLAAQPQPGAAQGPAHGARRLAAGEQQPGGGGGFERHNGSLRQAGGDLRRGNHTFILRIAIN